MQPTPTNLPDRHVTPISLYPTRSHPRKRPLTLNNIPAPIARQMDFTDTFMSLDYILASETNGRAGIKTEVRDETIQPDTHEGTLFSSPTPSHSSLHHSGATKLPDTTLPPLPSSPLLTPYSTSLRLPPLEDLPSTFSRKVHPAKLTRKRDREREKEEREKKVRAREKEKEGKEDDKDKEKKDGKEVAKPGWLPLEISRWGAQFRANPAHKMTKKSGKAMTTRMWGVSAT